MPDATRAWFFISAFCLLLSVAIYALSARILFEEIAALCVLLIVSFRFWPTVFNFALGQTNTPLLLCACAMFWADCRGKTRLAGCMIAIGSLLKPWMLGLLIYPLVRRNLRTTVWAVGFCCISLLALFAPLGWGAWFNFVHILAGNSAQPWLVSQSIAGFSRLHFAVNSHVHPLIVSQAAYYGFILFGYSIVGLTFVYLWSQKRPASSYEERLWFGLALLSLPLVSPLCHDEYFIFALPLLWTLLTIPAAAPKTIHSRFSFAALILYVLFTRPWPVSGEGIARHQYGLGSLLASSYFILGALLWVLGVFSVVKARSIIANIVPASLLPAFDHLALKQDDLMISAIVVSYNTREMTLDCLRALHAALDGMDSEVIVVDNASTDNSVAAIHENFPDVRLIAKGENIGFGAANNEAMRLAKGRFFLLINSDAFPERTAIHTLVAFIRDHPAAAIVGPRLLNADGSLQISCFPFPSPLSAWLENLWLSRGYRRWKHDQVRRVDFVIGACMLVRREAYEQIGGFDERFFMYSEEADWQRRMKYAGWAAFFVPDACVRHLGGASGANDESRVSRHFFESLDYYERKHHGLIGLIAFRLAMTVGCGLRTLLWTAMSLLPSRRALATAKARKHSQLCLRQAFHWN
jgi:GT2 family glycosyltransferase